jgi:hypothetical protein
MNPLRRRLVRLRALYPSNFFSQLFQFPGKAGGQAGYICAATGPFSWRRYKTQHGHQMVAGERHMMGCGHSSMIFSVRVDLPISRFDRSFISDQLKFNI